MTTYYRTIDSSLHDLTADQFAAMQANGKAAQLRVWIVDVQPIPTSTQAVTDTGIVVGATEAHQTWGLRDKTQTELNEDANTADAPNVKAQTIVNNLTTRIQLDRSTLTSAQRVTQLESDVVLLLNIARYYVRGMV